MLIVIAWTVPDFVVVDTDGYDLGRPPVLEACRSPRAVVWTLKGGEGDLLKAQKHAAEHLADYPDACVMVAPEGCQDPLVWARDKIAEATAAKAR